MGKGRRLRVGEEMSLLKRQKRASSTHHGHQRDKTKWNPTALPVPTPLLETISSLLASSFLYPPSFLGLDFLSAPFFFPSPSSLPLFLSPFSSLFSSATPRPVSTLSYPSSSSFHPRERREAQRERERAARKPFLHEEEVEQPAVSSSPAISGRIVAPPSRC